MLSYALLIFIGDEKTLKWNKRLARSRQALSAAAGAGPASIPGGKYQSGRLVGLYDMAEMQVEIG
ncbi:hypothetical protein nrt1_42510 [Pseudomonas aeruginosa]|nr:hypothetical protein VNPA141486_16300 [Pseudomonas aeruginosa]GLF51750.1 hypothetical protein VNPA141818_22520 [Pseudomonas aeruginosa]